VNNPRDFWQQLLHAVQAGERCVLMCVVESTGSSPGRAGFMMFVTSGGAMFGSIGGGSMEHKLVELARSLMDRPSWPPFLKRQVHQADLGADRSGMICSGEQSVAFHAVHPEHLNALMDAVERMERGASMDIVLGSLGFGLVASGSPAEDPEGIAEWTYRLPMNTQSHIAIIGGGHVGLALSRTMNQLGFHVMQYDHREGLNTMEANEWAHEKHVVEFENIAEHVPDDPSLFIALVSYGYRTDEICLRALVRRQYRYLGMLGSAEKVRTLFEALRRDGFTGAELSRVHAPIGLPIHSRTPQEIAVSIAAEIIGVKNGSPSS
jgi:xanthine dehydrogenase accessory factor